MKVWLVRDSDPLPIDGDDRRLLRSGLLAGALAERGHDVTWFTSSFDHYCKRQRASPYGPRRVKQGYDLQILRGLGYRANVSLARIRHNRDFARRFTHVAKALPAPDIVLADIPTTEAARAATRIAEAMDVPSIVSIRDLWPDFFLDYVPAALRPLARPALWPLERQVREATRDATALIGVSRSYLAWGQAKSGRAGSHLDRVFPLGYRQHPALSQNDSDSELSRLAIPLDRTLVAFVGSWGRTYDLDLVAGAAERLAQRTDLHFVVAGDPADHPALASRFAALPNVTLAGWLGSAAIAAVLGASAIGLAPYQANAPQGLPNKIFEYMAYGAYQISTLTGEAAELLSQSGAGETLATHSAEALAQAIARTADTANAGRADRVAYFDAHFSADAVYSALVDHIELVAANGRR